MNTQLKQLQHIINNEIQPASAMQFNIRDYDGDTLRVSAPIAVNTNHHGTVFGGSQYAIAAVAGWALLRCKLHENELTGTIVVKSANMQYKLPVSDDFTIAVTLAEPHKLEESIQWYREKSSSNFKIKGLIEQHGKEAAVYEGVYSIKNLKS
jgi:thioesterase domain-containing protein